MDKVFFYIIRHGESLGNIGMTEDPDPPLSPKGQVQAGRCADFLACELRNSDCTKIISSPLRRTVQTAEFIARKLELKFYLEPLLFEFYTENIFPQKYKAPSLQSIASSNQFICGDYSDRSYIPDEYETRDKLKLRMSILRNSLIKMLQNETKIKNIVLISHWAPIEELLSAMCKIDLTQIGNCSVSKILLEKGVFRPEYLAKADFIYNSSD